MTKTKFEKPHWAHTQLTRWDRGGMVEDICCLHGVGHPNKEWMNSPANKNKDGSYKDTGVHGCCGCCRDGVPYTSPPPEQMFKAGDKDWYKKGVRILMMIHRQKDGGSNRTDRGSTRFVSRNPKEFNEFHTLLVKEKGLSKAPLRIYSSANARNIPKAIRLFKMQQIELEGQSLENQTAFYTQAKSQFLSCLAKPQCADSKLFLVDVDKNEGQDLNSTIEQLQTETQILDVRETPNGYHVIVEPFNPALTPELDIKKDAMILLDW